MAGMIWLGMKRSDTAISSRALNILLNTDWSKINSRKFTKNCYEPSQEIWGEKKIKLDDCLDKPIAHLKLMRLVQKELWEHYKWQLELCGEEEKHFKVVKLIARFLLSAQGRRVGTPTLGKRKIQQQQQQQSSF